MISPAISARPVVAENVASPGTMGSAPAAAVGPEPELVSVTLPTVSPLTRPLVVNAVAAKDAVWP